MVSGLRHCCLSILILLVSIVFVSGCSPTEPPSWIEYVSCSPVTADIVFVACAEGRIHAQVWVVGANSEVTRPQLLLQSWIVGGVPAWRNDGRMLAVSGGEPGAQALWLLPVGTPGKRIRLAKGGNIFDPNWSADGTRLVWGRWTEKRGERLEIIRLADRTMTPLETSVEPGFPQWSPTGRWISFFGSRREGQMASVRGLYVISPDGTQEKRVDSRPIIHRVWVRPDVILYAHRAKPAAECAFWEVNVNTGHRLELFRTGDLPKWIGGGRFGTNWVRLSPYSALLVATNKRPRRGLRSNPVSEGDIYRVDLDGKKVRRLTGGGRDGTPCWSGDGSRIVFVRGGKSIWVMNADGSGQKKILDVSVLSVTGTNRGVN